MGQNLALNIAEKGFPISVYNRTTSKVDETVERAKQEGNLPLALSVYMEKGDYIIDSGNEWYEKTEGREKAMGELGLLYLGMGVSGGEEGAWHGPSMMPGGSFEAYKHIEDILLKLIAEAYDVLKSIGKLSNEELNHVFSKWNKGELLSFLDIFGIKDDKGQGYL
ncbi:hypothetical protein SO802_012352 [Lithocarpus litseifolius]|uniref:phosphogluconate dehydrogenase (NADP(+)-dependent, decarboxylating) n=1 Tax=Lithocarpus litseifolius TaxID=425828 RepID=A0AAW2D7X6_9ROSI